MSYTQSIKVIKKSWNNFICYPKSVVIAPLGSKEFFEQNRCARYEGHEYLLPLINSIDVKNKKLLEVGCGVGEDLVRFAKNGAICYAVDLTENAVDLTKKNFEHNNLKVQAHVLDAHKLPYDDNFFDIVYSFGVLHHSPDIEPKIGEIHRVLKPGGRAVIMLYYKNFLTYYVNVLLIRHVLGLGFLSKTFAQTRNEIEYKGCPYTMLYSKRDCDTMFKAFYKVEYKVDYFVKDNLRVFGKMLPKKMFDLMAKEYGFHLIILATK